ncbi:MAG: hypothetical protein COV76_07720 [Candidatus Omnitrophica bacterium CG11_big_fil_rev_8_21_14_0_20_64_10]|nr:MAG: hypothetical protein COV76_07720 [Candidatus Omnitrophica bacterium CG11_big_fil_rev_8_21_14_0_20_64_10]
MSKHINLLLALGVIQALALTAVPSGAAWSASVERFALSDHLRAGIEGTSQSGLEAVFRQADPAGGLEAKPDPTIPLKELVDLASVPTVPVGAVLPISDSLETPILISIDGGASRRFRDAGGGNKLIYPLPVEGGEVPAGWMNKRAAQELGMEIVTVVAPDEREGAGVRAAYDAQAVKPLHYVAQQEPLGTGHAVYLAFRLIDERHLDRPVIIMPGDQPLLGHALKGVLQKVAQDDPDLLVSVADFGADVKGKGRVVTAKGSSDQVVGIIEQDVINAMRPADRFFGYGLRQLDAWPYGNVSLYYFRSGRLLKELLGEVTAAMPKHEWYVTDVVEMAVDPERKPALKVLAHRIDPRLKADLTTPDNLPEILEAIHQMEAEQAGLEADLLGDVYQQFAYELPSPVGASNRPVTVVDNPGLASQLRHRGWRVRTVTSEEITSAWPGGSPGTILALSDNAVVVAPEFNADYVTTISEVSPRTTVVRYDVKPENGDKLPDIVAAKLGKEADARLFPVHSIHDFDPETVAREVAEGKRVTIRVNNDRVGQDLWFVQPNKDALERLYGYVYDLSEGKPLEADAVEAAAQALHHKEQAVAAAARDVIVKARVYNRIDVVREILTAEQRIRPAQPGPYADYYRKDALTTWVDPVHKMEYGSPDTPIFAGAMTAERRQQLHRQLITFLDSANKLCMLSGSGQRMAAPIDLVNAGFIDRGDGKPIGFLDPELMADIGSQPHDVVKLVFALVTKLFVEQMPGWRREFHLSMPKQWAVAMGMDPRSNTPAIFQVMSRMFLSMGVEVKFTGITSAPEGADRALESDPEENILATVVVTPSHIKQGHVGTKLMLWLGQILPWKRAEAFNKTIQKAAEDPDGVNGLIDTLMDASLNDRVRKVMQGLPEQYADSRRRYHRYLEQSFTGVFTQDDGELAQKFDQLSQELQALGITAVLDTNGGVRVTDLPLFDRLFGGYINMGFDAGLFGHDLPPGVVSAKPMMKFAQAIADAMDAQGKTMLLVNPDPDGDRKGVAYRDPNDKQFKYLDPQAGYMLDVMALVMSAREAGLPGVGIVSNGPGNPVIQIVSEADQLNYEVAITEVGEANVVQGINNMIARLAERHGKGKFRVGGGEPPAAAFIGDLVQVRDMAQVFSSMCYFFRKPDQVRALIPLLVKDAGRRDELLGQVDHWYEQGQLQYLTHHLIYDILPPMKSADPGNKTQMYRGIGTKDQEPYKDSADLLLKRDGEWVARIKSETAQLLSQTIGGGVTVDPAQITVSEPINREEDRELPGAGNRELHDGGYEVQISYTARPGASGKAGLGGKTYYLYKLWFRRSKTEIGTTRLLPLAVMPFMSHEEAEPFLEGVVYTRIGPLLWSLMNHIESEELKGHLEGRFGVRLPDVIQGLVGSARTLELNTPGIRAIAYRDHASDPDSDKYNPVDAGNIAEQDAAVEGALDRLKELLGLADGFVGRFNRWAGQVRSAGSVTGDLAAEFYDIKQALGRLLDQRVRESADLSARYVSRNDTARDNAARLVTENFRWKVMGRILDPLNLIPQQPVSDPAEVETVLLSVSKLSQVTEALAAFAQKGTAQEHYEAVIAASEAVKQAKKAELTALGKGQLDRVAELRAERERLEAEFKAMNQGVAYANIVMAKVLLSGEAPVVVVEMPEVAAGMRQRGYEVMEIGGRQAAGLSPIHLSTGSPLRDAQAIAVPYGAPRSTAVARLFQMSGRPAVRLNTGDPDAERQVGLLTRAMKKTASGLESAVPVESGVIEQVPAADRVVAVEFGGTYTRAALVDRRTGEVLVTIPDHANEFKHPAGTPDPTHSHNFLLIKTQMKRHIIRLLQAAGFTGLVDVGAVVFSLAGDIDEASGFVEKQNNGPMGGKNVRWEMAHALGLSEEKGATATSPMVSLSNDMVSAVRAEAAYGAGRNRPVVGYLTVSTGANGAYFHRASQTAADLGMWNDPQPDGRNMEEMASGTWLARMARERVKAKQPGTTQLLDLAGIEPGADGDVSDADLERLTAVHVGRAYLSAGDKPNPIATELVEGAASAIARSIVRATETIDERGHLAGVDVMSWVIGGGVARGIGAPFIAEIQKQVQSIRLKSERERVRTTPIRVLLSAMEESTRGLQGAAAATLQPKFYHSYDGPITAGLESAIHEKLGMTVHQVGGRPVDRLLFTRVERSPRLVTMSSANGFLQFRNESGTAEELRLMQNGSGSVFRQPGAQAVTLSANSVAALIWSPDKVQRPHLVHGIGTTLGKRKFLSYAEPIVAPESVWPSAVAFSPDRKSVVIGGDRDHVLIQNVDESLAESSVVDRKTGEIKRFRVQGGTPDAVAWSPGNIVAVATGDGLTRLWDVGQGADFYSQPAQLVGQPFRDHFGFRVNQLLFSRDGRLLVSGDGSGRVVIRNLETGRAQTLHQAGDDSVNALAFLLEYDEQEALLPPRILASAGEAGAVYFWDVRTGLFLGELQGAQPIRSLAFMRNPNQIAAGRANGSIKLWPVPSFVLAKTPALPAQADAADVSPLGSPLQLGPKMELGSAAKLDPPTRLEGGLEEREPGITRLPAGATTNKVVLLADTDHLPTDQILNVITEIKLVPSQPIQVVIFTKDGHRKKEIEGGLEAAGIRLLEPVVDVAGQYGGDLGAALADRQLHYMAAGLETQTVLNRFDLRQLGRFLGMTSAGLEAWDRLLTERRLQPQA